MTLITPDELKTMNYSFQGKPFIDVPATGSVILKTMLYCYLGQPFIRNYTSTNIKSISNVLYSSIKSISSISISNIKKVSGIS